MVQDDYREKYKEINKNWMDSVAIYRTMVKENIKRDMTVLEAGCGFCSMFKEEYKQARRVIGVDVSEEFIKMNEVLDEKIVANLESIPQIEDGSVDLIISSWVFEHIENPKQAFSEFSRVLKKGGKLIFLTPNSWNFVVILNRIVPDVVRNKIVVAMSKDLVTEPMPTFYRANSRRKLKSLAMKNDLIFKTLITNGDPTYVAVNELFFYVGVAVEAILSLPILRGLKVHLIGECVKK